jgi:hypothetical protein
MPESNNRAELVAALRERLPGSIAVREDGRVAEGPGGTQLVNGRTEDVDRWIDRRSRFGNPFKLVEDGGEIESRERSVDLYEGWFRGQLRQNAEFRNALSDLRGKRLGCWCLPQRCHGEIVLRHLAQAYSHQDKSSGEGGW